MAGYTANKPKAANQILLDLQEMEDNFEFFQEVFAAITGGWGASSTANLVPGNRGQFHRARFTWKDADEIYINFGPGGYHHDGTTDQMVYCDTQLTYKFGSAGSNALSDDLGASEWHYLYLDDTAIVTAGTNIISVSELVNDTTAPTWTVGSHAWMNGDDRCIGAFLTDSSNNILEFFHDGGDLVVFADEIAELAATDIDTTWTDVDMATSVPGFSTKAEIAIQTGYGASSTSVLASWRTNGQTGSSGHPMGVSQSSAKSQVNVLSVITDSSQIIEVKYSGSDAHTLAISTSGWYFPIGM
jgi:hypothetical protein